MLLSTYLPIYLHIYKYIYICYTYVTRFMDKKIALQEERPCLLLDVHLSVNYARDLLPGLSLLLLLLSLSLKM